MRSRSAGTVAATARRASDFGKDTKRNEPALVVHVAEALASARRATPAAIVEQTAANFEALFGKK